MPTEVKTRALMFSSQANRSSKPVVLYLNEADSPKAPMFDGTIDDRAVALWVRNGANGKFLSIHESQKRDGTFMHLGTANVIVNAQGMPRLSIKLLEAPGRTLWAHVRKEATDEILANAGLDLVKLAEKRDAGRKYGGARLASAGNEPRAYSGIA